MTAAERVFGAMANWPSCSQCGQHFSTLLIVRMVYAEGWRAANWKSGVVCEKTRCWLAVYKSVPTSRRLMVVERVAYYEKDHTYGFTEVKRYTSKNGSARLANNMTLPNVSSAMLDYAIGRQ